MRSLIPTDFADDCGMVLPMVLIVLCLMTSLIVAFVAMTGIEPLVAANQEHGSQAQAFADAGIARALWALTNGAGATPPNGAIKSDLSVVGNSATPANNAGKITATAPFDGAAGSFLQINAVGGTVVTVTNFDPSSGTILPTNQRSITAVGWTPTNDPNDTRPKGIRKVQLTASTIKVPNPPGALTIYGDLSLEGATVNANRATASGSSQANTDSSCGNKEAAVTAGTTFFAGGRTNSLSWTYPGTSTTATRTGLSGSSYTNGIPPSNFMGLSSGADGGTGTSSINQAQCPSGTCASGSPIDGSVFSNADLDMLKTMAQKYGYYQKVPTGQTGITFNYANPLPNKPIIFIDTPSGNDLNCTTDGANNTNTCTNPSSDLITVTIGAGASSTTSTTPLQFNGWIIVNGSITTSGQPGYVINGLLYAQNDISLNASPVTSGGVTYGATINGAVISRNVLDTSSSNLTADTSDRGTVTVNYNCANSKLPSGLPTSWFVVNGTYQEVAGQ